MTISLLWVDADEDTSHAAAAIEAAVHTLLGHENDLFPFHVTLNHTAEDALADRTPYKALIIEPSPLWQACKEAHNQPPTEPGQPKLYNIPTHILMRNFRADNRKVIVYSTLLEQLLTDAGLQHDTDYTHFVPKPDCRKELPDIIYSIVTGIEG